MMWSWILTAVGLTGFVLAGRKVWWAWYINIGCLNDPEERAT